MQRTLKDLILACAEQDGGAHEDPEIQRWVEEGKSHFAAPAQLGLQPHFKNCARAAFLKLQAAKAVGILTALKNCARWAKAVRRNSSRYQAISLRLLVKLFDGSF